MAEGDAERDVDRAEGVMNRIARGGPVATVLIVVAALLIAAWVIGLLR